MKNLLYLLALMSSTLTAQCDVAISSWNAITGDIVIEAINSENCGCNEFTTEGNTCENSGSSYVSNNATIGHIVLGLHVEGLDNNWGCTTANNHPGWTFKAITLYGNQVLESGDTWSANVYDYANNNDCWSEMLSNDTLCTELVVWQINLSQTSTTDNEGWAVNPNISAQTQNYPDVDISNNTAINCALPTCDTIFVDIEVIEYITDTIIEYIDVEWVTTDTLYITDTIEVVVIEYVIEHDIVTEFYTTIEYLDCESGLSCDSIFNPCDETSIYAPNIVTPNNDGWNDTWKILSKGECWDFWEVLVYNRWGELVWSSESVIDEWIANVTTGTYVYTIRTSKNNSLEFYNFNGVVNVLR